MSAAFDEAFDFNAFDLDTTGADTSLEFAAVTECAIEFETVTDCTIEFELATPGG